MHICILILLSLCTICSTLAANVSPEKPGAGIENKNQKTGVCWFNSVTQALRASHHFRAACAKEASKKNVVMKKMNAFIRKIDRNTLIEESKVQKLAKFMIRNAKKKGYAISGNPWSFTEFLLQSGKVETLPFSRIISVKSDISGFKEATIRPDSKPYMLQLVINTQTKPQELSHLLFSKQKATFTGVDVPEIFLGLLSQSNDQLGLKKLPRIRPSSKMHYEEEIDITLKNEHSAPPLIAVSLRRMRDKKQGLIQYLANEIHPTKSFEVPLESDRKKKARYELVSVVATRLMSNISGKFIGHAYSYVTSSTHGQDVWIKFNDSKVMPYSNPKGKKKAGKSKFTPYDDISKHGSIYFYELVGFS